MTQVEIKRVNEKGLQEIHDFLAQNHKLGGAHFDRAMLLAWAEEAEQSLGNGNPAQIEIRSFDCVRGEALTYTVSDAGIDTDLADDGEA